MLGQNPVLHTPEASGNETKQSIAFVTVLFCFATTEKTQATRGNQIFMTAVIEGA